MKHIFTRVRSAHANSRRGLRIVAAAALMAASSTAIVGMTVSPAHASASDPFGHLDVVQQDPNGVLVEGWAIDPDVTASISVRLIVDGSSVPWAGLRQTATADAPRADLVRDYAFYGSRHGFTLRVGKVLNPGLHTVCVEAMNVGLGTVNSSLGCKSLNVLSRNPQGNLDAVRLDGGMGATHSWISARVHGWAIDANTTDPIDVRVYVNGKPATVNLWSANASNVGKANFVRTDVGDDYRGYGNTHGFDLTATVFTAAGLPPSGPYTVCVVGLNVGPGSNSYIGSCATNITPSSWTIS